MRIPCCLSNSAACVISSFETAISELPSLESKLFELMEAGAAGQALQNTNLIMGWEENLGLQLKASTF